MAVGEIFSKPSQWSLCLAVGEIGTSLPLYCKESLWNSSSLDLDSREKKGCHRTTIKPLFPHFPIHPFIDSFIVDCEMRNVKKKIRTREGTYMHAGSFVCAFVCGGGNRSADYNLPSLRPYSPPKEMKLTITQRVHLRESKNTLIKNNNNNIFFFPKPDTASHSLLRLSFLYSPETKLFIVRTAFSFSLCPCIQTSRLWERKRFFSSISRIAKNILGWWRC